MSISSVIHRLGGVARTSRLEHLGISQYRVRLAARSGDIVRLGRGWVALPDADADLAFAAEHGVVLSCITEAKRLGLWVLNHGQLHVSARTPGHHADHSAAVVHWRRPIVPRHPDQLTDHLMNTLDCVAACQPVGPALAVWDSALQQRKTDYPALAEIPWRGRAKTLLTLCTPFSDSGIETLLRDGLRWLRVPIRSQITLHGHRIDFLIGDRLIIQVDGASHTGAQRTEDIRFDAFMAARGYTTIRISYEQIVYRFHEVQGLILEVIARGRHLAPSRTRAS
ncbi:DUF559 domain-containing protein [Leucobacter japonicus]|uniref:DUF559 domain-containing protein n=1 Tax=Leucobacter japonicus TaxID=1461259 RepID=UPI0006A77A33|nr:DUF559 domain-containing protein [Leucobacter japonicus]